MRSRFRGVFLKKFGQFWLPDVDCRGPRHRLKSERLFTRGCGPKIGDLEAALAFCGRWTVAVDGGANVGAYTRVLMERFERVLAFEPASDTFAALERNLGEWEAGKRVEAHRVALSDRSEGVAMGTSRGRRSPSRRVVGAGDIAALPLDALDLPDLAFLKLDLEGYEERALRGAERTLRRFRPLVMFEEKPRKARLFGDPRDAHRFLESLGARALACIGPKGIDWVYGFDR